MVPSHVAVLAREPFRPALPEDDAPSNHVFSVGALRAEALSRGSSCVSVSCTLSGVGGVTDVREGEESKRGGRWF